MKNAIVVFHGMGDQTPMDTLNSLADAVWVKDEKLIAGDRKSSSTGEPTNENEVWSKPDSRNRSFELYRLTTGTDKNYNRADFYEFYWAHHVEGTKWEQAKTWLIDLMWRWPSRVPNHVRSVWWFLWVLIIAGVALVCWTTYVSRQTEPFEWAWLNALKAYLPALSTIAAAIAGWLIGSIMVKRVGDVVRYTKQKPENIAIRQTIRDAGVQLLQELNAPDSGYDRVIIVAHSLGTIVAYDILTHAFARCHKDINFERYRQDAEDKVKGDPDALKTLKKMEHQPELKALETFLEQTTSKVREGQTLDIDLETFRCHQKKAQEELAAYHCPWRVSDFITLGSPLTHAEFLMSDGLEHLRRAQMWRQLPTCPPVQEYEGSDDRFRLSFDARRLKQNKGEKGNPRIPHHGAMFAFTRWTNIYSPRKGLLGGDLVSGPVARLFGQPVKEMGRDRWHRVQGIKDVAVLPQRDANGKPLPRHKVPRLTHNNYWNLDAPTGAPGDDTNVPHHIKELRAALHLLEK